MRLVLQRVKQAQVSVEGKIIGSIGSGILALLAVHKDDLSSMTQWLAQKMVHLRIFSDDQEKMNLSLMDIQGEVLIVSQFTLYGECSQGRRPDFLSAAPAEKARSLYEQFIADVKAFSLKVESGVFGAHMEVSLINDGPVTLILDAK